MIKMLILAVGAIVIGMLVMRVIKGNDTMSRTVQTILGAKGAVRCLIATEIFQQFAERGNNATISVLWEAVEMPLLQALPDCPPDQKLPLANALTDAAKRVTNRGVAKRMMDVRNSLLA
jgi:hypothetical protein